MNILILSPGYPAEMPQFTRGLAEVGAKVFGVGDQGPGALPELVQRHLSGYLPVRSLWDEAAVVDAVRHWPAAASLDGVECLWEPGMLLAARLREALHLPGLSVAQTVPFRDKEAMKQVLDRAGLRTPRHIRCGSVHACWEAAERSASRSSSSRSTAPARRTPTASSRATTAQRAPAPAPRARGQRRGVRRRRRVHLRHRHDPGQVAYHNIAWYRPRPLVARSHEWISPQVIALRHVDQPALAGGVELGLKVIKALGFQSGFTHMEWYRKADGEVVFGEIGARPPGAHQVDQMNAACDFDVYREWGRAVAFGRFDAQIERKYNVSNIYKRAHGEGHITRIAGLDASSGCTASTSRGTSSAGRRPASQLAQHPRVRRLPDAAPPGARDLVKMSDDIAENLDLHAA
jgi:hypothetical protein